MAKFKINISDPKTGKTSSIELEGPKAQPLIGHEIGDLIDGSIVNLTGKKLKITGGSDKNGFPMKSTIHGGGKKQIIISNGTGFNPKKPGERRRKIVRGRMITEETYQINMKVAEEKN
jgi:small subunit ribosomal protein S6e